MCLRQMEVDGSEDGCVCASVWQVLIFYACMIIVCGFKYVCEHPNVCGRVSPTVCRIDGFVKACTRVLEWLSVCVYVCAIDTGLFVHILFLTLLSGFLHTVYTLLYVCVCVVPSVSLILTNSHSDYRRSSHRLTEWLIAVLYVNALSWIRCVGCRPPC